MGVEPRRHEEPSHVGLAQDELSVRGEGLGPVGELDHLGVPDGWNPPAGAVPITGGEVDYEMGEAADIENPFDANAELGAEVYRLNCVQCHGPDAEGDGIMAEIYFPAYEADVPPNLREATGDRADGEIFWIVTNGLGEYMPAFRMLLTEEERWALVDHLREIEQ
jgi:mono/diheme cytochrome c family protein